MNMNNALLKKISVILENILRKCIYIYNSASWIKTKNIEFVSKQNYFTFVSFVLFAFICKHQQQSRVPDKINIVHNENGHILVYLQLFLTDLKWGNFCNFSFDMMNVLRSFSLSY